MTSRLDVFILRLAALPCTRYLAAQVATQAASLLEGVWLGTAPSPDFTFERETFQDLMSQRDPLSRQLFVYTHSCKLCRVDWQYMSIVTDKGDGGGLGLQQTIFTFPDNVAFLAVPQVRTWPLTPSLRSPFPSLPSRS